MLTRDPSKCGGLVALGAESARGDLGDYASLLTASRGVDAVAFMLPAFLQHPEKALEYAKAAMKAAREGGAQLVVWNTSARFPESGDARDSSAFLLSILEVLKASGLPLTTIAPTTYMENLLGPWTAESVVTRSLVAYPVLVNRRMGWIAARDVGKLVIAALERPTLAGRIFRVSGVEGVTGPQLAEAFSAALGRHIGYYAMSPAEMKAALEKAFGPGAGDKVAHEYALDQADPSPPAKWYDMAPVLRELPVEMTTLRAWISAHAAAFTAVRP
jgi:uncharacterized protein YbjT (DUF2867 family)